MRERPMRPLHRLASLTPVERMTIDMIRRIAAGELPDPDMTALADLAGAVMSCGWTILPPHAPLLGSDEMALLGWLARHQRVRADFPDELEPRLEGAFHHCAVALAARGWRLSRQVLHRLGTIEVTRPTSIASVSRLPIEPMAPNEDVRDAIRKLAARKPVMSARDLRRLGLWRPSVNRLCRVGLLVRTGVGLYRMG